MYENIPIDYIEDKDCVRDDQANPRTINMTAALFHACALFDVVNKCRKYVRKVTLDSSVGRAVDCSGDSLDIHRSLVRFRFERFILFATQCTEAFLSREIDARTIMLYVGIDIFHCTYRVSIFSRYCHFKNGPLIFCF